MEEKKTIECLQEHVRAKKKLVLLIEAMGGGVFTYMVDLANELTLYYEVSVVYAIRPQTPVDYEKYFQDSVNLVKIENFTRPIRPKQDWKAYWEVKKVLKDIQPDIIHIHSSKAGVIGRLLGLTTKIPMFYTPHGYSFLMKDSRQRNKMIYFIIEWVLGKINCTTIACSEGEFLESKKVTKKACYINNGINTKKLNQLTHSIKPEKANSELTMEDVVICTIGRICTQKNPTLFNQIAEKMPHMKFLWIGDGELREVLTSPNIMVTGWCSRTEALKHCAKCSVFILSSLWEGLPISLLEAMGLGKICLVSDVVGNHDVIDNGVNGFVCADLDEFIHTLRYLLDKRHRTQIEGIIAEAYENIQDGYDTKLMGKEYDRVYRSTIEAAEESKRWDFSTKDREGTYSSWGRLCKIK